MENGKWIKVLTLWTSLIIPGAEAEAAIITITDTETKVDIDGGGVPGFNKTVLGESISASWTIPQPANMMTESFVLTEGSGGPASDIIRLTISPAGFVGRADLFFQSDAEDPLPNPPADAQRITERTDGEPQVIPFTLPVFDTIRVINDAEAVPEPASISVFGIGLLALLWLHRTKNTQSTC